MSNKHTAEFKAKVALEASGMSVSKLSTLAKKYEVTETEILSWVKELNEKASHLFSEDESHSEHHAPVKGIDVTLETSDEELIVSVAHGVNDDNLNYKRLTFWSLFGTAIVVVMVIGLVEFSQFAIYQAQEQVNNQTVSFDITRLQAEQNETLNSFGVVDLENGVYRIPIDSAISRIAKD